jgi:gamma-glutamylcyclotransferase (GGCT)/AIG2-like uncharacterized protein YtfP
VGRLIEQVFGYGSLAIEGRPEGLALLPRHRRVWGVATDNARAVPGYKMYLRRSDGSRPGVYVAFVDYVPDEGSSVRGIVRAVTASQLEALDRRERNYDRVEVTGLLEGDFTGRVWAFRGSAAGRERLRAGREQGRAVISRDYLEKVQAGLGAIGDTCEPDLPVWDLERVDLPANAPPAEEGA